MGINKCWSKVVNISELRRTFVFNNALWGICFLVFPHVGNASRRWSVIVFFCLSCSEFRWWCILVAQGEPSRVGVFRDEPNVCLLNVEH